MENGGTVRSAPTKSGPAKSGPVKNAPESGLRKQPLKSGQGAPVVPGAPCSTAFYARLDQASSSSAVRLRTAFGSTGMLGPIDVVSAAFLTYRPFAADGLRRWISSTAAA